MLLGGQEGITVSGQVAPDEDWPGPVRMRFFGTWGSVPAWVSKSSGQRIGKEAALSVLRAGEIREIRVTVGTRNGGGDG